MKEYLLTPYLYIMNKISQIIKGKGNIPIIGVGGIYSGSDAFEFFLCGASLVQIASAYKAEGASVFERIEKEFIHLMHNKNYSSVEDFRGKLKIAENEDYGFSA